MSVAVAALASTYFVLKMLRPLFSIAPMLKSLDGDDHEALEVELEAEARLVPARPTRLSELIACSVLSRSPRRT